MKNDNHTRVFGPLSAGCILMLALSACSTSVQGIGSEDSTHGGSGASSSASATSHEKQIVGLTDDNKAGTSRPRSDQKPLDSTKNVKLKDDGSWTVEEDNNGRTESVSVNADGTFQVKNKNSEDSTEEFTLNADGSWEKIEKGSSSEQKTHVNADGTWTIEKKYGSEGSPEKVEMRSDGSWESTERANAVITGKPDGTAIKKNTKLGEEKPLTPLEWKMVTTPKDHDEGSIADTYKLDEIVPENGVIPLKPRKSLPLGIPVKEAVPGTDEYKHATAELEGILLTDENKAGKPRPRSEKDPFFGMAKVNPDGSWSWESRDGDTTIHVAADGTWTQKDSDNSGNYDKTTVLYADGSWEIKNNTRSDGEDIIHVNPDGSWQRKDRDRTEEVKSDGTWRTQNTYETVYSTPDGKVYRESTVSRESSSRKSEVPSVDKERYIYVPPQPDLLIGGGDGPGGGGVIPLTPRQPLQPGQQAVS